MIPYSLGSGPARLTSFFVFESAPLTLVGIGLGVFVQLTGFSILQGWLQACKASQLALKDDLSVRI